MRTAASAAAEETAASATATVPFGAAAESATGRAAVPTVRIAAGTAVAARLSTGLGRGVAPVSAGEAAIAASATVTLAGAAGGTATAATAGDHDSIREPRSALANIGRSAPAAPADQ